MTTKTVRNRRQFASASTPGKCYETLMYADGTTSCQCAGWTRRVAPDGSRSCRHTIEMEREFGAASPDVRNFHETFSLPIAQMINRSPDYIVACVQKGLLERHSIDPQERIVIERMDTYEDSPRKTLVVQAYGRIEPKSITQVDCCSGCDERLPDNPGEEGWVLFKSVGWVCPMHTDGASMPAAGFMNVQRGSRLDVGNIADRLRGAPAKPTVIVKSRPRTGQPNVNQVPASAQPVRRRFNFDE